jgi:SPW repeat-containing protein
MQMKRGPLSLDAHAMTEPLLVIVFIAAPWIFGFSDVSEAKTISIAIGVLVGLTSLATKWRYSLVKLVPIRMHMMADILLSAVWILSPFVFGFSDNGAATRFMIIAGVLELGATLMTRWDPAKEVASNESRGGSRAARA